METIHLNAEGVQNYVDRYGKTIHNVSKDFKGPNPSWAQKTDQDKDNVIILLHN